MDETQENEPERVGLSPTWVRRPHEERVRLMLGWIVVFTGIIAVSTVVTLVQSIITSVTLANSLHY